MTDGANYVGRRVVVVTGAIAAWTDKILVPLVEGGAEVHVIGAEPPSSVRGLASRTVCDVASADSVASALERVGAVVQHLFHCAVEPPESVVFGAVALAVKPLMHLGGSIVAVRDESGVPDPFVRDHGPAFAADGIRLAIADPDDALRSGLA